MTQTVAVSSTGYTGPVGRELVTAPTAPVLPIADLRARLRLPFEDEDVQVQDFLEAAVQHVEDVLGRKLAPQTWRWWYDDVPAGRVIVLPEPARTVVVKTYDTTDAAATLSASDYVLDTRRHRIVVDETVTDWPPSDLRDTNALSLEVAVGYATLQAIPASIRQALHLLVQGFYLRGAEPAPEAAQRARAVSALLMAERFRMGVA